MNTSMFASLVSKTTTNVSNVRSSLVLKTVLNKINKYYKTKFDYIDESYGFPVQSPLMLVLKFSNLSMSLLKNGDDVFLDNLISADRLRELVGRIDYEDTVHVNFSDSEKDAVIEYVIKTNSPRAVSKLLQSLIIEHSKNKSYNKYMSTPPLLNEWDVKYLEKLVSHCDLEYRDDEGHDMLDMLLLWAVKKGSILTKDIWSGLLETNFLKNRVSLFNAERNKGVIDSENPYRFKGDFGSLYSLVKSNFYTENEWFGNMLFGDNNLHDLIRMLDFEYAEKFEGVKYDKLINTMISDLSFMPFIVGDDFKKGASNKLSSDDLLNLIFKRVDLNSVDYCNSTIGSQYIMQMFCNNGLMTSNLTDSQKTTIRHENLTSYIIDNTDFNIKDNTDNDGLVYMVKSAEALSDYFCLKVLNKSYLMSQYKATQTSPYDKGLIAYCLENIKVFDNKEKSLNKILKESYIFSDIGSLSQLEGFIYDFFNDSKKSVESKSLLLEAIMINILSIEGVIINDVLEIKKIELYFNHLNENILNTIDRHDKVSLHSLFIEESAKLKKLVKEETHFFHDGWLNPSLKATKKIF